MGEHGFHTIPLLKRINNIGPTLDLRGLNITSLPSLKTRVHLKSIFASGSPITRLPELPPELEVLNITESHITELPQLPPTLIELSASDSSLTSLPALPPTLLYLTVSNTGITSLPELPNRLKELLVSQTQITSLPALPPALMLLDAKETPLTSLPALPNTITYLDISETQITELPPLPSNLGELMLYRTPVTSLPALPPALHYVYAAYSALKSLPDNLNTSQLTTLNIENTAIKDLPPFPDTLYSLYITGTSLPPKKNGENAQAYYKRVYGPVEFKLQNAIELNDENNVRDLLTQQNININTHVDDKSGNNLLTMAIEKGNLKIIEMLVDYPNIDVNKQNNRNFNTPLFSIADYFLFTFPKMSLKETEKIVDILSTNPNFEINAVNKNGDIILNHFINSIKEYHKTQVFITQTSPLTVETTQKTIVRFIKLLIDKGISPLILNNNGQTILDLVNQTITLNDGSQTILPEGLRNKIANIVEKYFIKN